MKQKTQEKLFLMTVAIYVTKLIFHKYHLEDISFSITKENMIVACGTKHQ